MSAAFETQLTTLVMQFQQSTFAQIKNIESRVENIEARMKNIDTRVEGLEKYILTMSVNHDVLAKKNSQYLKEMVRTLPEGDDLLQG